MSDRDHILQQIDDARAQLDQRLNRIDDAHGDWQGAIGDWSVAQLLQHMHGWLTDMTVAVERMINGQRPTPEGVSYDDPDAWNLKFISDRGQQSYSDARAALNEAHDRFRERVAQLNPERFGDGKTINQLVDGTVIHHYAEHANDIDTYLSGAHD